MNNPDQDLTTLVSPGNTDTTDTTKASGSYSDPNFPVSVGGEVNIRVPGFPSVITDWLDRQTDEIYH